MSTNSSIEWTDTTWNPVVGCTWASPGCDHCYAARMTRRLEAMGRADYVGLTSKKHFNGKVRTLDHKLAEPLSWKKPCRVFVNSMSDLFHGGIYGGKPDDASWFEGQFKAAGFSFLCEVWNVMRNTPRHTYQILTKRPRIMADLVWRVMGKLNLREPLPNVWLLTSVENQPTADQRIPYLLRCPAAVRGLSVEPLLGPVTDLRYCLGALRWEKSSSANGGCVQHGGIHWVIIGGESGPGARPMHPDWARSLRDQCAAAGVPFFFKQWGAFRPKLTAIAGKPEPLAKGRNWGTLQSSGDWWPQSTPWNGRQDADSQDDSEVVMVRVGKKAAGRLLDGREWNEMPIAAEVAEAARA